MAAAIEFQNSAVSVYCTIKTYDILFVSLLKIR